MTLNEKDKAKAYDKMIEARKRYHFRRLVRIDLIIAKAREAKIIVTEKEVDDEVARRNAKK